MNVNNCSTFWFDFEDELYSFAIDAALSDDLDEGRFIKIMNDILCVFPADLYTLEYCDGLSKDEQRRVRFELLNSVARICQTKQPKLAVKLLNGLKFYQVTGMERLINLEDSIRELYNFYIQGAVDCIEV